MNTRFLYLLLLSFTINISLAQELPKIVPLSPNAASMAKYGEIPVGHFTGTTNINIPIYDIKSGNLNLPLSLSYHSGGNRVEAVASWVGLGWSLGTIPVISRSVRGLPDDHGGYFNNVSLYDLYNNPVNSTSYKQLLYSLNAGEYDSEPDIFSYNINGESGKFFYNQELDEFVTTPVSNIKIIKEGSGQDPSFTIISKEGIEYTYDASYGKEQSAQIGYLFNNPSLITTSWYVTKIKSANKKDSIVFNYEFENHQQKIITSKTKYQYIEGNGVDTSFLTSSPTSLTNYNNTKRLASIFFKGGSVEFIKNTTGRLDLDGGYSLKEIIVKDNNGKQINKFDFEYKYISRTGCPSSDEYSRHWLLLDKFKNNSSASSSLTHSFVYNENFPPCRNSFAQDFWGYYNGETQNQDLIPPASIPNSSVQIPGANRNVNPSFSQFGILKTMIYPTGGYTEFDYENNQAISDALPKTYIEDFAFLESDYEEQPGWPFTNYYEETFSINNPSDLFLNNDNINGGAFVNFEIGYPGCDLSQGANVCADFRVIGTSPSNSTINYTIHQNTNFHLPNGNYKITALFDQDPPQYESFFFTGSWYKVDSNSQSNNKNVGGLRIKEIRSYADSSPTTIPLTKKYKYTIDYNSTESSGLLFGLPKFKFSDIVMIYVEVIGNNNNPYLRNGQYLRLRSHNNIQQISHSGSFVGYKTIIEETIDPNETGVIVYNYTHSTDITYSNNFPFPPAQSTEARRGQLAKVEYFKKSGNTLSILKSTEHEYSPILNLTTYDPFKNSYALKTGKKYLFPSGLDDTYNILKEHDAEPDAIIEYELASDWNNVSKTIEKDYYGGNIMSKTTDYFYDNTNHLFSTRTETTDSDGELLISKTEYPQDVLNPSASIVELINQNRLSEPIEVKTFKDLNGNKTADSNELLKNYKNIYKAWPSNIVDLELIQVSKGTNSLENRIEYLDYYANGNIKEVSKSNGTHIIYVWGYNEQYPIAKIENATFTGLATNIQTAINSAVTASNNDIDTPTEDNLRTALNTLRDLFSNAMVSTYTYDPLIGATSMTDPKGYTIYYHYDAFNRLEFVKDADGNIVSENKYNYKN